MSLKKRESIIGQAMERFSLLATEWTGSSWAFGIACAALLGWLVTGPLFGFSDSWQLVINTGTNIVTLLMVFLIQRAQNKESRAVQLKLNEIVASIQGASNRLIDVEALSEREIQTLREHYGRLLKLAGRESDRLKSHSVEEAQARQRSQASIRKSKSRNHRQKEGQSAEANS